MEYSVLRRWVCFFILLLAASAVCAQDSAKSLYKQAEEAEKAGEVVQAYLLYSQAAALDPDDNRAWAKSQSLRTKAALAAKVMPKPDNFPLSDLDPLPDRSDTISPEDMQRVRRMQPPPELTPDIVIRDFEIRGDSRQIIEQVLKAYGVDVIFDGDYQPIANLRFQLNKVGPDEAMDALEEATGSFLIPVSPRMALAARDSQQKRQQLEPNMEILIPLPAAISVQEVQEAARAVQQILEIRRFSVDSATGMALLADSVPKVRAARLLFDQMMRYRSEVVIEVDLLETSSSSKYQFGTNLQSSFPITWLNGMLPLNALNVGTNFLGLGIADAQLFASFSKTTAHSLFQTQIRSVAGAPAELHIGDRYPIVTSRYNIPADADVPQIAPSFNYEDLGISLKITPTVHSSREVTLAVDAEYKVLTGDSIDGNPILSQRVFNNQVRLETGQWAILGGLLKSSEARTLTGIAGLMQVPVLGALFRSDTRTKESSQTLIVIKPHIVSLPPSELFLRRAMRIGTAQRPKSPI